MIPPPRSPDEDEHVDEERRHQDRRASYAEQAKSVALLEQSLTRAYRLLAASLVLGGLMASFFGWLGWRNQGPGSRIDALALVVQQNATLATMRDSIQRINNDHIWKSIQQTGYTACLMTVQGKTIVGSQECAAKFLDGTDLIRPP